MQLRLDSETQSYVDAYLAYVPRGVGYTTSLVHDGLLTALLSRGKPGAEAEAAIHAEIDREGLVLDGAEITLDLSPRTPGDRRDPWPAAAARLSALADALAVPHERLPVLYLTVIRVGMRMLTAGPRAALGATS